MVFVLLTLIIVSVAGVKFSHYHADYLDKTQTVSVKGVFAILILLSHMRSYYTSSGFTDTICDNFFQIFG